MSTSTYSRKTKGFFLLLFILVFAADGIAKDYRKEPLDFFKEFRTCEFDFALGTARDLYKTLEDEGYPFALELVSVVFPELMRYSVFQNELETLFNKCIALASEESEGFSIGLFQMKPSFACKVERLIAQNPELKSKYSKIDFGGDSSTSDFRRERILRLNDIQCQLEYLKAFADYEILSLSLEEETFTTRLALLSAAYNYKISAEREVLERAFLWETFPSGRMGLYFNYQLICLAAAKEISR